MEISREQFDNWLQDPVTQELRRVLGRRRQERKDSWEHGELSDWSKDTHILLNAAAIGECKGYAFVQELDFDTFIGELGDEE